MKAKLIIVSKDKDYIKHFSDVLAENHVESFDIKIMSDLNDIDDLVNQNIFDAALIEENLISKSSTSYEYTDDFILIERISYKESGSKQTIGKYQRISSIAGEILGVCSKLSLKMAKDKNEKITAVWSPCGGVGKTSVALGYASRKSLQGKNVIYLCLENFSSVSTYFDDTGKSISTALEKLLDKTEENITVALKSIKLTDSSTNISYFCPPNNYKDMNVLGKENIKKLCTACAMIADEIVIDISSNFDEKTEEIFKLSDEIYLVCDGTENSNTKVLQFTTQNDIWQNIKSKCTLINNKDSDNSSLAAIKKINLPIVKNKRTKEVYKTLSTYNFN